MSGQLIKPYEISVWEDTLTQNGFVENKLAIIGSDTMTGLNKIYDPVFNKKSNGERSLTFSLKYHYIDPRTGEEVTNPFADLLMNERRVKLHYDGQWYEFIVKEHEESSDESTWTYTCTDAFVLELSKCGYNITFDSELNNNQGTAAELAQETIKNTDWRLGTVDNFKQYISEPLYFGTVASSFEALNTDNGSQEYILTKDETIQEDKAYYTRSDTEPYTYEIVENPTGNPKTQGWYEKNIKVFNTGDEIYVFYSYIRNKDGINLQFIEQADTYVLDDDKVIIATNYRITDEVVIEEDDSQGIIYNIKLDGQTIIQVSSIENRYQANRLVYKQLNTYDPVMERTVDRYISGDQEVYSYIDYVYTTSNVITSFITNGENFNILEDGSLQGWNPYVDFEPSIAGDDTIDKLELVTKPDINATTTLADLSALSEIEGFLKVRFKGALTSDYKNAVYNSGFENNSAFIKSVAEGDKFVFRWRAGQRDPEQPRYFASTDTEVVEGKAYYERGGQEPPYTYTRVTPQPEDNPYTQGWYEKSSISDINCLKPYNKLKAVVAKYTQDAPNPYKYYYKHIDSNNIIMEFKTGEPQELNNYIRGGTLRENYKHTDDIKVYDGKTYYVRSGEQEPYTYTEVVEPKTEDISEYYERFYTYVIDDVVQTPSTKYIYEIVENNTTTEYVWNGLTGEFEIRNNDNYLPYYYLEAEATKSVSNKVMQDVTEKIGIFVYTTEVTPEDATEETTITDSGEVISSEPEELEEPIDPEDDEGDDEGDEGATNEDEEVTYSFTATLDNPKNGTTITVKCHRYESGSWQTIQVATFVQGEDKEYVSDRGDYTVSYNSSTETITYSSTTKTDTYKIIYEGSRVTLKNAPIYIQDIQLTRFVEDGESGKPITIGNIPVATSASTTYYYLKPNDGAAAEDVELYTSLETLTSKSGLETIPVALYNENSEKYLSITEAQSNCFNILQSIAETFECWVELDVDHDDNGYITYTNGLPNKFINLKEYAGVENYAGFKYGINLASIERTVSSDEIVTKLIVNEAQCEYVEDGYVSIASAPSNASGESYILDFDYYFSQGLLNEEIVREDITNYADELGAINSTLKEKEKQKRNLEAALTTLGSKRNVYTKLVATAQELKTEALGEFENLTGQTYDEYRAAHEDPTVDDDNKLTEEETIVDIIGTLYANSAMINNYSGILTNIEQEYWQVRHQLRGLEQRLVRVWEATDNSNAIHIYVEIDDYFPGFKFTIGENEYESTVSKKFFDISFDTPPAESPTINFIVPNGYSMDTTSYTVDPEAIKVFKVIPDENQKGIQGEIDQLRKEKEEKITAFENKYCHFIQEGTWNSTDYIDSELYYLDALQASKTSAFPTIDYTINVVEISELEGFEWYLFDAGDKTYVEDTEFFGWENKNGIRTPAREEVVVSEVEWHLEEPDKNTITVQNYKTHFEDFFQRVSATVQAAQYNDVTLPSITTVVDANGLLNPDVLGDSIGGLEYALTSNGAIAIENDSILIRNLTNPTNRVMIDSEGIKVSSDGGNSWSTAIDGRGLDAGLIYTGSLNTDEVIIGNKTDKPSFRWDKSGLSAFKSTDNDTYDLQTYVRFDEYGLYGIQKNEGFKAQNLDEVKNNAWFAVTWDGFFIRNSYEDGGRVSITSEDDFQVIDGSDTKRIKIGSLGIDQVTGDRIYGINISDKNGNSVLSTDNDGDLTITGTINALGGNFADLITVGKDDNDSSKPYIEIDGRSIVDEQPHKATIQSSNYGANGGWMINADGDAVFNNITARGAIKTAVFEYAEIQAVGGIFIFRPSSTIREAELVNNNADIEVIVDNPAIFKAGQWCKVSNYYSGDSEPDTYYNGQILQNNGLINIYPITKVNNVITLVGAGAMVGSEAVIEDVHDLIGGALIDMGNINGTSNYGIGINSSDNIIDLPPRAISLFKTEVHSNATGDTQKVTYNYQGILGTLPQLDSTKVNSTIYNNMVETQGIYTDNMYIGNNNQYIAFYQNGNNKQLSIKAEDITFNGGTGAVGNDGFLYLSTHDYGSSLTINNYTTNTWREIIGTKFGVTSDGVLSTANANVIDANIITALLGDEENKIIIGKGAEYILITEMDYDYRLTSDEEIVEGKPYYQRILIDEDYDYIKVLEPDISEINTYYEAYSDITYYIRGSVAGEYVEAPYLDPDHIENYYEVNNNSTIRYGKTALVDNKDGFYIGTDGISLGVGFTVGSNGTLIASDATITGDITAHNLELDGDFTFSSSYVEGLDGTLEDVNNNLATINDHLVIGNNKIIIRSGDFKEVQNPAQGINPKNEGWYEFNNDIYVETTDEQLVTGKTYYEKVRPENDRLLIDSNGLTINNKEGAPIAFYGEETIIGNQQSTHIKLSINDDNMGELGFYNNQQKVAYINGDKLYIGQTVVLTQMDVGDTNGKWSWKIHDINGKNNLYLKWLG